MTACLNTGAEIGSAQWQRQKLCRCAHCEGYFQTREIGRLRDGAELNGRLAERARCARLLRDFALLYATDDPRRQALQHAARGLIETSGDYPMSGATDPVSGEAA